MEQLRLLIAVVLSFIVFFAWNHFFVKKNPQLPSQVITENIDVEKVNNTVQAVKPADNQDMIKRVPVDEKNFIIETPAYIAEISSVGAKVKSFKLKNYKAEKKDNSPLKELVDQDFMGGSFFAELDSSPVDLSSTNFYSSEKETKIILTEKNYKLDFEFQTESGVKIKKEFVFYKDSYLFDCNVSVINNTGSLFSNRLVFSLNSEKPEAKQVGFVGPAVYSNNKLNQVKVDDIDEEGSFSAKPDWMALETIYFISALIPDKVQDMKIDFTAHKDRFSDNNKEFIKASMTSNPFTINNGEKKEFNYHVYIGPKSLDIMAPLGFNLKKSVNFGFFDAISKPCLIILNKIYMLIPNYGISIILLTLFVKIIFWPLGTKSAKSMEQMKRIQPLMQEIRNKYKDDKQKMNQEIMSLYKTYKVNPLSGCLPILVQIPIFFGLYRMLFSAIELRHAPFMLWLQDLSAPDRLFDLTFAIPFMKEPYGIPLLTIIMGLSMFLQQKMTPTGGDPTQAKMMMFMPIMITVIFVNLPAGLVLYMLVNNLFSMGQQLYVTRSLSK